MKQRLAAVIMPIVLLRVAGTAFFRRLFVPDPGRSLGGTILLWERGQTDYSCNRRCFCLAYQGP